MRKINARIFALMLCVSALILPAYAVNDTVPPTVSVWLNGDTLRIEANDNIAAEAVYVDSHRFNYLVDEVLEVNAREYNDNGETISIYAIDFDGNKSEIVLITNPYYMAVAVESVQTATDTTEATIARGNNLDSAETSAVPEASVQTEVIADAETVSGDINSEESLVEPEPLTPEGNLSLVDDISGAASEDKQIITVVTRNGNYFYIIIDRASDGANTVHFLNQVDEADLLALIKDEETEITPATCICGDRCIAGAVNTDCPVCAVDMVACTGKEATPVVEQDNTDTGDTDTADEPETKSSNNGGLIIFILLIAVLGGGAVYYFKVLKNKTSHKGNSDLDDYDFGDEDEDDDPERDDAEESDNYEDRDTSEPEKESESEEE